MRHPSPLLGALALALLTACSQVAPPLPAPAVPAPAVPAPAVPPPSAPSPPAPAAAPAAPPSQSQTPPVAAPSAAAMVGALIAQADARSQDGGRVAALADLESARGHAVHNPELLARISRAAWQWDRAVSIAIAREAVAADDASVPAQLALGTALHQAGKATEARTPLERAYERSQHALDSGYAYALVLESLHDPDRAKAILADLGARFPASTEVRQALDQLNGLLTKWPAPGTPGTSVAGWQPGHWWATADLLIGTTTDGQAIEAIGRDGAQRWRVPCDGKVIDVAFDAAAARAILFTDHQGCLIDVASGRILGVGPGVSHDVWLEGFAWRDDFIALGEAVKPAGAPASAYFGTTWQVYRLAPQTGGKVRFELLYTADNGARMAALSRDGQTLFSWFGNHGAGLPRLFRNGSLITTYPDLPAGASFRLDPRDDRLYFISYNNAMQALSLDGKVRWQAETDQHNYEGPLVWADPGGQILLALASHERTVVYTDDGLRLWDTPGYPIAANAHGLLTRQDNEVQLLNRSGDVIARYPQGASLTRDGRAVFAGGDGGIDLYRLP